MSREKTPFCTHQVCRLLCLQKSFFTTTFLKWALAQRFTISGFRNWITASLSLFYSVIFFVTVSFRDPQRGEGRLSWMLERYWGRWTYTRSRAKKITSIVILCLKQMQYTFRASGRGLHDCLFCQIERQTPSRFRHLSRTSSASCK